MKGMDLTSALAAPVQGRDSGQGARSRSEAGNTEAESFDTVFNDVHGVADAAHRQTDDAGADSAADRAAQGADVGSAAVQIPAVAAGNEGAAFAESAGHASGDVAGGPADQPAQLTWAPGLPVQDGQAPPGAPATVAISSGPDPRLAVPGTLLAATTQPAALQTAAPGTAPAPGLQTITAPAFTGQGPVADQALNIGGPAGVASGSAEAGPPAAPVTGTRSATVLGNVPAPNTDPAGAPSSTAPLRTAAAGGSASDFPAAALAEGVSPGPARTGTTPATTPVTASGDALAAAGTAAAAATAVAAPAGQPTSPTAAAPQPAAPAAPQPGATLQPQLAKPLFTLAGAPQGQHIMTLQVTPEDLGPMTVRAHIDAAGVRIELFAPGDAGREAIRGILPELRKELADAGFGASLDVSEDTGPGSSARNGTSQDRASQGGAARDSGSGQGNRNGPGDPRPGHRWASLADGDALRDARILNGPQTTLDILV